MIICDVPTVNSIDLSLVAINRQWEYFRAHSHRRMKLNDAPNTMRERTRSSHPVAQVFAYVLLHVRPLKTLLRLLCSAARSISHQLQSLFQLCLALTNFAKLLSHWKIFQVAHFAQKTEFRFGWICEVSDKKSSLMSLGIKRKLLELWSRQRVFKRSVPVSPF